MDILKIFKDFTPASAELGGRRDVGMYLVRPGRLVCVLDEIFEFAGEQGLVHEDYIVEVVPDGGGSGYYVVIVREEEGQSA